MTGQQVIRMSFMENDRVELMPTLAWEIKYTRRWAWAQRLCWWVLTKTGATVAHFEKNQLVKQVAIDTGRAATEIVRMAEMQLAKINERPKEVLLGRAQFEAIVSEPLNFRHPFGFPIQLAKSNPDLPLDKYGRNFTLYDLPVRVIPWMDGVLVL